MTWDVNHTKILRRGHYSHGSPYSFAVGPLLGESDDNLTGARIYLADDETEKEWEIDVQVGETFEVGKQTWRLDSVGESEERPAAWIRRIS